MSSTTSATAARKPVRRRRGSQAFLFTSRPDALEVDQDVYGLDGDGVIDFVVESRRRQDVAAAQELRGLTAWADLHRITDGMVGSVDNDIATLLPTEAALLGRQDQLRLAGQGTFMVTEFGVAEIAAALAMSEPAARAKIGQALELRDRLPRLWERVLDGDLPAWKGCRIAAETIPLNIKAARYVDAHLAPYAPRLSVRQILRCVNAAINLYDPAAAKERAERAGDGRGVWTIDTLDGVSELHAVADTPDIHALDTALTHTAAALSALGDTDPEQTRRAKALGILADPQHASTSPPPPTTQPRAHPAPPRLHRHRTSRCRAHDPHPRAHRLPHH